MDEDDFCTLDLIGNKRNTEQDHLYKKQWDCLLSMAGTSNSNWKFTTSFNHSLLLLCNRMIANKHIRTLDMIVCSRFGGSRVAHRRSILSGGG